MTEHSALSPKLIVEPERSAVDQEVSIRFAGFKSYEEVGLTLRMHDTLDRAWSVEALYRMNKDGAADCATAPVANRLYPAGEHMRLFSLLRLEDSAEPAGPPVFMSAIDDPLRITLTAEGHSGSLATAILQKEFIPEGVITEEVRSRGIWGRYFYPESASPLPAVLVLGGAIGASLWTERAAATLAGRGYATLALTYFSTGHLPADLVEIPMEYFSAAIAWLRDRSQVDPDRIGVLGKSKGAEAALLLGTLTSDLNCYACINAPAVLYQGIQASGPILSARSSWTYRGQAMPFVPCYQEGKAINISTLNNLHRIHSLNLNSSAITFQAAIAVEKIGAPLLLLAGEADDVWPSVRFGEMMMSRLARHSQLRGSTLHTFANAGHGIDVPNIPITPFGGGGTSDIAAASLSSWQKIIEFFAMHLQQ